MLNSKTKRKSNRQSGDSCRTCFTSGFVTETRNQKRDYSDWFRFWPIGAIRHSHVRVAMVPNHSKYMLACYDYRRFAPAGKKKWRIMTFVCFLERLVSGKRCLLNVYKISFVSHVSFRSRISTKGLSFLAAKSASKKRSYTITVQIYTVVCLFVQRIKTVDTRIRARHVLFSK